MRRCLQYFFTLMMAVLFSAAPLPAVDQSWTGSINTDFTTAGNWAPGGTLLTTDDYYVNIVGATCPTLASSTTVGKLQVGTNYSGSILSGKVIVNYSELTANDEVCIGGNANTTATSYLEVNSGVFTFARGIGGDVRVGFQGGKGQMNLSAGATVNIDNGGRLFVGDQTGKGQLNMDSSTVTLANNVLVMGCGGGAEGTATLNNVSTLNINGGMLVGDGGTGYMTIAGSSTVTNLFSATGGNVEIGRAGGNGTLDLVSGTYSQNMSDMVIGTGAGSTGEVKVAAGSTFNYAGTGTLYLGNEGGHGTITMSGGTFDVTGMMLGRLDNAQGTFNMTGGTINKTRDLCIGFDRGLGTMTLGAGTVFNSTGGAIEIGRNTTLDNKLSMSGGEINHKDFGTDVVIADFGGRGTLEMTGGTFNQSVGSLYIGHINYEGRRAQGYLNISGSAAYNFSTSAGTVYVGNFDCDGTINITGGSMTLSNGAALKVGTSTAAEYAGSVGTINMNGGTLTNGLSSSTAGATYIGSGWGNTGTLNMSNGATYNHGSSSNCFIGDNVGTGILTMVGSAAGVDPAVVTTFNCPKALRVGNGGTGTIEMHQNSLLNAGNYLVIGGGNSSSAVGTLTMTGNAAIVKTGGTSMFIGENLATGHATMSDTASITTSTADLEIGKRGGVGDLTMNGSSSLTLTGRTLYAGYGGTGVATMKDSSVVSTTNLRVGQSMVDGATETPGNGTLNMNNGTLTILSGGNIGIAATIGKNFADATLTPTTKTVGKMYVNGGSFTNSAAHFVVGGTLGLNTADNDVTSGSNHDGLFQMTAGSVTTAASSGVVIGGTLGIHSKNLNTTTGSNNVGSFEMTGGNFSVGASSTLVLGSTYKTRSGSVVNGTGNVGTFHLNGGTFTVGDSASMFMGYSGDATVTVDSGLFDASAVNPTTLAPTINASFGWNPDSDFVWSQKGGKSILPNITVSTCPAGTVIPSGSTGPSATFNLDGGVFATNTIRTASNNDVGANGFLTVNFNGGILQARQSTTFFIYRRSMPAANCHINVTSNGGTIDANGVPGRFALGAEIREAITSTGEGASGALTITDTNTLNPNTGVITLSGNNAGFLGNITITGGTLAGGGNSATSPAITPSGDNAFGLGSAERTITVGTGGTLAFRHANMYAGDYSASAIPTILVNGGTLAVQPIIAESGTAPNYVYTYAGTRAAVNNVTLNNGSMTSMTATTIGSNAGQYAWNLNGTLISKGSSKINYAANSTPSAPAAVDGLIALQSGDMANPNTTFDVQDGTLSVASTLTDGLSTLGVPRATSLTKTGDGTMTITGALTYTGNTAINGGILQIDTPGSVTLSTITGAGTLGVGSATNLSATSIVVGTLVVGGHAAAAGAPIAAVPEPSVLVLLLLGLAGAVAYLRRK